MIQKSKILRESVTILTCDGCLSLYESIHPAFKFSFCLALYGGIIQYEEIKVLTKTGLNA